MSSFLDIVRGIHDNPVLANKKSAFDSSDVARDKVFLNETVASQLYALSPMETRSLSNVEINK